MNVHTIIKEGLQSNPKYLPVWYRYDKQGSIYNDKYLNESPYYYLHSSEIDCISKYVSEMIDQVQGSCILVDLGIGNPVKTRMYIEALLKKQEKLKCIAVDISDEYLQEVSNILSNEYGERLDVQPITGDYTVGIEHLANVRGNKLILWLGSIIDIPYVTQVDLLQRIALVMTENDRLLISIDGTQDKDSIEKAYDGSLPVHRPLYLNGLYRLNRDYGSVIDTDNFDLETIYEKSVVSDSPSFVMVRVRSKHDTTYDVPGLGISVNFKAGECLNLHEGDGVSRKYSDDQIRYLIQKTNMKLTKIWKSDDKHVVFICLQN